MKNVIMQICDKFKWFSFEKERFEVVKVEKRDDGLYEVVVRPLETDEVVKVEKRDDGLHEVVVRPLETDEEDENEGDK